MTRNKIFLLIMLCIAIAFVLSACQSEANTQVADEAPPIEPTEMIEPAPAPEYPRNIVFLGNAIIGENGGVEIHLQKMVAEIDSLPDIEVGTAYKAYSSVGKMWTQAKNEYDIEDIDCVVVFETFQNIWEGGAGKSDFFANIRRIESQAKDVGAETIMLMGWGHGEYGVYTQDIADTHNEIAEELGIKVAPVGLAFDAVLNERPDYDLFTDKNIFLTWRATYLATMVLYATIYEENPAGLTYQLGTMYEDLGIEIFKERMKWLLDDEEMSFLQRIAWETVTSYPYSGVTD